MIFRLSVSCLQIVTNYFLPYSAMRMQNAHMAFKLFIPLAALTYHIRFKIQKTFIFNDELTGRD